MLDPNDTDISNVSNLEKVLKAQIEKLDRLRGEVRELQFVPIEPMGYYTSVTYKAIDGGKMSISFEPLEMDLIEVADSFGNLKMRFVIPLGSDESRDQPGEAESFFLDEDPIMKKFLNLFSKGSVREISEILNQSETYMELSEWACIFERIIGNSEDPVLLMRDGLLRTKKIKAELIPVLLEVLKQRKHVVKLVGVSKTSKVLSLLSTAIWIERKFPPNGIGYVKVPQTLEMKAYNWTGSGRITDRSSRLYYAFGDIYVAKLSRNSNLLVTVEIPRDIANNEGIYSEKEIAQIMAHLAKDSSYSYPILGYPQTIMKAHEAAVRVGFPASVLRDKILDKLRDLMDPEARDFTRDSVMLTEFVNKGVLGGGRIDE
ncbi:MAG: DNA double-strand break repair nuclease NurA [Thermoplasmata archaeon]